MKEKKQKRRPAKYHSQYKLICLKPKRLALATLWILIGMVVSTALIRLLDTGVSDLVQQILSLI